MKRFVNSSSKNYHHATIEDFSDKNKFLASGSAKGHNTVEYSWVADTIFKSTGNLSLNPNVCYLSFFSDREIMYQEFGNVQSIRDAYPFFSAWERALFPDLYSELETKQYFKVGQRYAEFDLVEYINPSEFITTPVDGYRASHQFYRAPVFHAEGYKLNMDDDGYESFDKYLWTKRAGDLTTFNINEYFIKLNLYSGTVESELSSENYAEYSSHIGEYERILDYKIHADNPKYTYFDSGIREWVMYYNETNHYQAGSFYPYIGSVATYAGDDWLEDSAPNTVYFFPEIIINGVLEPAKAINTWQSSFYSPKGRMIFNPGSHLNDSKDQSRVVYSVSKDMINNYSGKYQIRREIDGIKVVDGIDIDTERNRRYSAVVMTEPYFTVEPMGSGQLVEYSFVDENGDETSIATDKKFLKIKSSLNIFSEIDAELNSSEYNTDIINVFTIKDITATDVDISDSGDFYNKFKDAGDSDVFYNRQEACLDDLIGGVVGTGNHRTFWMDAFGVDAAKYSNDKIKICGLGVTWDYLRESGSMVSKMNLNIYCTNYEAINSPAPGVDDTPIANDEVEFLSDPGSVIDTYLSSEKFKPMIKVPGMNGYVKIMKKNTNFSVTRSSDGGYEKVYNIEFPYCPGSLNVRGEDLGVLSGFIYKKKSYISAGSQEADSTYNTRYDSGNDRYSPYGDDGFCKNEVLYNPFPTYGTTSTDPFSKGGGQDVPLQSTEKKQIHYPNSLVWRADKTKTNLFSLTKPRFINFKRYGTYEINFSSYVEDIKLFCLVDNRQWKFSEDKFASYIGRENPSYIFEIDASKLFEDFTKFQALHGPIPDTKRWLYGYFTGFAHTMLSQDNDDVDVTTEKLSTMGNNSDILSSESKSDITIEIWDQESDLGNDYSGNWRPFISLSSDNHKVPGPLLVDNIYISDVLSSSNDDPTLEFADIYSIYIGYMERDDTGIPSFVFPENVRSESSGVDILDGRSNVILYDKDDNISMHVAYIKKVNDPLYTGGGSDPQQVYKLYVKADSLSDFKTIDIEDINEDDVSQYQIRLPFKTITKNPRFSTTSIRAVDGVDVGFLVKYLDLRGDGDPHSDSERFVSSDKKIRFRVRPTRGKKHPSSYFDKDNNEIPYVGSDVGDDSDPNREELNFPWYESPGVISDAFDWAKIKTEETVRKFGLNYFKCASK